jgi:quinol monooxygenase YgiN
MPVPEPASGPPGRTAQAPVRCAAAATSRRAPSCAPTGSAAQQSIVSTTVAEIRQHEPGTLLYGVHTVDGEPARVFYELYRDEAAFQAHESQPHVRYFLGERDRLLERVVVDRVAPTVYAGLSGAFT